MPGGFGRDHPAFRLPLRTSVSRMVGELQPDKLTEELPDFLKTARKEKGLSVAKIRADGLAQRSAWVRAEADLTDAEPEEVLYELIRDLCAVLSSNRPGHDDPLALRVALNLAPEITEAPKLKLRYAALGRYLKPGTGLNPRTIARMVDEAIAALAAELPRVLAGIPPSRLDRVITDDEPRARVRQTVFELTLNDQGILKKVSKEQEIQPTTENFDRYRTGHRYETIDGDFVSPPISWLSAGEVVDEEITESGSRMSTIRFAEPRPYGVPFRFRLEREYDTARPAKSYFYATISSPTRATFVLRYPPSKRPRAVWHYEDVVSTNVPLRYREDRAVPRFRDDNQAVWSHYWDETSWVAGIAWSFDER